MHEKNLFMESLDHSVSGVARQQSDPGELLIAPTSQEVKEFVE